MRRSIQIQSAIVHSYHDHLQNFRREYKVLKKLSLFPTIFNFINIISVTQIKIIFNHDISLCVCTCLDSDTHHNSRESRRKLTLARKCSFPKCSIYSICNFLTSENSVQEFRKPNKNGIVIQRPFELVQLMYLLKLITRYDLHVDPRIEFKQFFYLFVHCF